MQPFHTVTYNLLVQRDLQAQKNVQSFEFLIRNLSLAKRQLMIKDKNYVSCIKIDTAQNNLLLSGDNMGKIRLFDLTMLDKNEHNRFEKCSSNIISNPECHKKLVTALAWYPLDSGLFISTSNDGFVNIWDTEDFSVVSHINFKQPVLDIQMPTTGSFNHKLAASCTGGKGSHFRVLNCNGEKAMSCCWNPINEYEIIVGDEKGICLLYDIRKTEGNTVLGTVGQGFSIQNPHYNLNSYPILSCLYSSDGRRIIIIDSSNQPIHVYDSHSLHSIDMDCTFCHSWGRVVIKPSVIGEGEKNYLFYPDPVDCCIKVIDIENGEVINTIIGHMDATTCCDYRKTMNELFSGGRDGFILKYDCSCSNNSPMRFTSSF